MCARKDSGRLRLQRHWMSFNNEGLHSVNAACCITVTPNLFEVEAENATPTWPPSEYL